jgi:exosortase C (VPDSG-CTERM-specific)
MMYSFVLLVPFISGYLIRERWPRQMEQVGDGKLENGVPPPLRASDPPTLRASPLAGSLFLLAGLVLLAWYWTIRETTTTWHPHDRLALVLGSYLLLLYSAAFYLLGTRVLRALAFPVIFLIFILPLPTALEYAIEVFFQYTSAEASALMFSLTGTPVLRDGLTFQLPGITLEVARECSGINSSYVLFITSLIAGHLFLRKPWKRVFLALFVIPLAIFRNGFRIVTIGMLCVHIGPDMIHSIIHRRGGPFFFALSLIPFFLVLLWLRRGEQKEVGR